MTSLVGLYDRIVYQKVLHKWVQRIFYAIKYHGVVTEFIDMKIVAIQNAKAYAESLYKMNEANIRLNGRTLGEEDQKRYALTTPLFDHSTIADEKLNILESV